MIAYLNEQVNQYQQGSAFVPSGSPYNGNGGGSGSAAAAVMHSVTPTHQQYAPSSQSQPRSAGYTPTPSAKYEYSAVSGSGASPDAYTAPYYAPSSHYNSTAAAATSSTRVQKTSAYVQSNKTTAEEVYHGVRSLGLDKHFDNLDFLQSLRDSPSHSDELTGALGLSGSGGAAGDLNLDDLDYYSIPTDTKRTAKSASTGRICCICFPLSPCLVA